MQRRKPKGKYLTNPRFNAWHITINTNSTNPQLIEALDEAWNYMRHNMSRFLKTRDQRQVKIIKVFDDPYGIEVSPKGHRIHLHGNLRVDAYGILDLNLPTIKNFFNNRLRPINPNINIYLHYTILYAYNDIRFTEEYNTKARIGPRRPISTEHLTGVVIP